MPPDSTPPPHSPRARLSFNRADMMAFARTLIIGAAGGTIFYLLDTPLPWMMGAMFATGNAALAGLELRMDSRVRTGMIVVLGVLLGAAFSPDILDRIPRWPISLAALVGYVVISSFAAYAYFRYVAKFDPRTAFFSGIPGGLNEMIVLGQSMGADDRQIGVSHTTRIFLVVMVLPILFRTFDDQYVAGLRSFATEAEAGMGPADVAILAACAIVGIFGARALRIPAPQLTGPMILSAAVHLTGLTDAAPPVILVAIAQVFIGGSVGARFSGLSYRQMGRIIRDGGVATLILLAITAIFAVGLSTLAGFPFGSVVLAYSPGGFTEMSLVALALNIDTAFVATHHITRITIVVFLMPWIVRLLERSGHFGPPPKEAPD